MSDTKWSEQQNAIFSWFKTPKGKKSALVVIARAGSGKTTTIIEAVDHAPEKQIILCAFNKIIADELSSRIKNPNAQARTLHSIGNGFIFKAWGRTQIDENRGRRLAIKALNDANAPREIVRMVADLASKIKGIKPFATYAEAINIAIDFELIPEGEYEEMGWTVEVIASSALRAMQLAQNKDGSIDFDDMIYLPLALNLAYPKFDLCIVDEAQDMNASQLMLASRSCRGRMVLVGDDRQAIYGFRGADSGSLGRLQKELSADVLPLNITYRCPQKVVKLAQFIVPDFNAGPNNPEGEIINTSAEKMLNTAEASDFILSRTNAPLAKICLSLLRRGKRAVVRGRDIGKTIITLVKKMEASTMEQLHERLGAWANKMIDSLKAQGDDVPESKFEHIYDQVETIRELSEGLTSVAELLARIEGLFSDNNINNSIICSSIHKAKGLEARRVFVLEETMKRKGGEEDNIKYVAYTRSKGTLVLVEDLP